MARAFAAALALVLSGAFGGVASARAEAPEEALGFEQTPPRLSLVDGAVSFWREGAEGWTPAQPNTPLAAGDALYLGADSNAELQIGPRAFARAGESSQVGLADVEPDYLQLRVTEGTVSLDLRGVRANQTFELAAPNAAFTIERSGYYRVEVDGDTTTFTSRRGGRATVTPATGAPLVVAASEQVVVTGTDAPRIETYAAPELDGWDRWNYARTDDQLDAVSARYVSADVYGVHDLDPYGDWRVVPTYGAVWVPSAVAVGWAPYSTGRWIWDPFYGWTWVDAAPWGWAPFHYGRWVFLSGYWAWCPGPLVVRTVYAPALVAFYGGGTMFGFRVGGPRVGWVALGWGEPLVPWWGPASFRRHAHWAGWGGPHVVNDVVVNNVTVVDARQVGGYQNAHVHRAIVTVERDRFGRHTGREQAFERGASDRLKPLGGEPPGTPDRSSLVVDARPAPAPPRGVYDRSVVATREPHWVRERAGSSGLRSEAAGPVRSEQAGRSRSEPAGPSRSEPAGPLGPEAKGAPRAGTPPELPPTHVVSPAPKHGTVLERPPFGSEGEAERRAAPPPPRYPRAERASRGATPEQSVPARERGPELPPVEITPPSRGTRPATPAAPSAPVRVAPHGEPAGPRVVVPAPAPAPATRSAPAPHGLPGEPANRVYRVEPPGSRSNVEHGSRGAGQGGGDAGRSGPRGFEGRGSWRGSDGS